MKSERHNLSDEESRKAVSELVFAVLTGALCVREAIQRFPQDIQDPSIHCAWHALVHYESDEEFRRRDIEYRRQQDDYLEMIGFVLKDGMPLPANIISEYEPYHREAMVPRSNAIKGVLNRLMRFINR